MGAEHPTSMPSPAAIDETGRLIALPSGRAFIPATLDTTNPLVDLLIHFHGDPATVAREFAAARVDGLLLVVNYPGLSSAYARPHADPARFDELMQHTLDALHEGGHLPESTRWGRVFLSSFSAGYGALREILKHPPHVERIEGLLMLDSLYAGYVDDGAGRRVNPDHMADFRRFARLAVEGHKSFILTHSDLVPGSYASTLETADDLLRHVDLARGVVDEPGPDEMKLTSRATRGGFRVLGYAGDDGPAHMQHLRRMRAWIDKLPWQHPAQIDTRAAP